jgi:hypothetical protein
MFFLHMEALKSQAERKIVITRGWEGRGEGEDKEGEQHYLEDKF